MRQQYQVTINGPMGVVPVSCCDEWVAGMYLRDVPPQESVRVWRVANNSEAGATSDLVDSIIQ